MPHKADLRADTVRNVSATDSMGSRGLYLVGFKGAAAEALAQSIDRQSFFHSGEGLADACTQLCV
jgi:hypothetical protein